MTAAHCEVSPSSVVFAPIVADAGAESTTIAVAAWARHPSYRQVGFLASDRADPDIASWSWDDVAVATLASCPTDTDPAIQPVPLARASDVRAGVELQLVGYGATGERSYDACIEALPSRCQDESPEPPLNDSEAETCFRAYIDCLPASCGAVPQECWREGAPDSCDGPNELCAWDYAYEGAGIARVGAARIAATYERTFAIGPSAVETYSGGDFGGAALVQGACGLALAGVVQISDPARGMTKLGSLPAYADFVRLALRGESLSSLGADGCNPIDDIGDWAVCPDTIASHPDGALCRWYAAPPPREADHRSANCEPDMACGAHCGLADPDCADLACDGWRSR